jgi:hypothetical protein
VIARTRPNVPGSTPRLRFTGAVYRTAIAEKLDARLSLQRIWHDLVEEYGYGASYESVNRFVRADRGVRGRNEEQLRIETTLGIHSAATDETLA